MDLLDGFEHIARDTEPLAPFTSLRVGGAAQYFAEPTTIDELSALVKRCREAEVTTRLLGSGTNLLVRDEGTPGMVIHLSAPCFSEISVSGSIVRAGGGTKLAHVISSSVREGLSGLHELAGIPGTVGGALHGNAGSHATDIGQWTKRATVLTRSGEILERSGDDLRFAYRSSSLDELAILDATFELEEDDPISLTKRLQKLWIVHKSVQPKGNHNCGYIFKDPGGLLATELIDQSDLSGAQVGAAKLSEEHSNFIVCANEATASDVLRLIDLIREGVEKRTGTELEIGIEVW